MRTTRGQAALEFLTTYGWAFLVILVMIAALAYFGVISPNKFLPERCTFQQEFTCRDWQVLRTDSTHANVKFFITNNLGTGVTGLAFNVTHTDGSTAGTCTAPAGGLGAGESGSINCSSVPGQYPSTGDKTKFQITGTYQAVGGQYPHTIQGEIFATLQ